MRPLVFLGNVCLLLLPLWLLPTSAQAAPTVQIHLPLGRTAYQTNEWIDVSILRSAPSTLAAGDLVLTLSGDDSSRLSFTFPVKGMAVAEGGGRAAEHLHVNGRLLRPGKYTVEAAVDGARTSTSIEVYSHLRKSSFRLVNWGRAQGKDQLVLGEESLGFNLFYGGYGQDEEANFIRAGMDFMSCCTMSGGHQMDLRMECDWSDPYVTRGGTARVVRRAFQDRTRGNVPGVHFYDEPGLTWWKHAQTGEFTPHGLPPQVRSYVAAFGREPIPYNKVDPKDPEHVARWRQWARWKLGFMDAAWKEAQFGVSQVRPDFLSATQSQYGWTAFTDGYYFNVVRSLPINSGHGGYDDFGPGYFNPSFFLEMARARDFAKPCWYLPCWYGNTPSDRFRLEQYLSFQTGIQGMMSPPDLEPAVNPGCRQGIVEANHLMKRLGPIFTTMPVSKPPVALLYSLSQAIHTQTRDREANYAHALPHGQNLTLTYLAGKILQQQFLAVVEEDILDGTLANDHKAIIVTSLDYLDPKVIAALEDFAHRGGLVLLTGDCTVSIRKAVKLPVKPRMPDQEIIDRIMKEKKYNDLGPYTTVGKYWEGARPLAQALKSELDRLGIQPPLKSDLPSLVVTRQAAGDVEYLFAVNATYDGSRKQKNDVQAAAARLTLAEASRPIYDALLGGSPPEFKAAGDNLIGAVRFGPGQMRVFARTARPIGSVRIAKPVLHRDLVCERDPIKLEVGAIVLDDRQNLVSGSIPLHIRVIDPLGATRHELYRATNLGQLRLSLPLAANDPGGTWKITVRELLDNHENTIPFNFTPPARAAALAGMTHRAVTFGNDVDHIFRFARLHRSATIVLGTSRYHAAAAARLRKALEPWEVRCQIVDAESAARPRRLTEEEAKTWVGLAFGKVQPGDKNSPGHVGFAVRGPVNLLGHPEDNPIIKFLHEQRFLPYSPRSGSFPGPGRGLMAWQRDGVGHGQESVTLIAHDAEGMDEAVGTFYEAVAGLEPLTKWQLPDRDSLAAARTVPGLHPAATVAWSINLPDRVDLLQARGDNLTVLAHDGTWATVGAGGKVTAQKVLDAGQADVLRRESSRSPNPIADPEVKKQTRPDRILKLGARQGNWLAVAYWGGTLRILEGSQVRTEQRLPQDITALTWVDGRVAAGLSNGQVLLLQVLPTSRVDFRRWF